MLLDTDVREEVSELDACNLAADRFHCGTLVDRVRSTFPRIDIKSCRLDQTGGDHVLLIVNEELAFRFPREGMHGLQLEMAVLGKLRQRTAVAVPAYDHVDPAGHFAGYQFIDGVTLTNARFASSSRTAQDGLLAQVACFLTALHDLSHAEINWSGDWPRAWTADQFADRGMAYHLPLIAGRAPHLAASIEAFYKRYRRDRSDRCVILHGDLVVDHILVDPAGAKLTGIIDFGDVSIGDPAQDFADMWTYGQDAVAHSISCYDALGADPGLLDRSRNHFVRYRIDRLVERLNDPVGTSASSQITGLEALLTVAPNRR